MPGPGPHLMYAMGSGLALTSVTNGRFSPHHTLTYTANAFFGPDIGSFSEWLGSLGGSADTAGSAVAHLIHHPLYYILILGLPLSFLYSRISSYLVHKHLLDSVSKAPLTRMQCFFLISAGSFTHFFLDDLFEENGKTTTYTWILSTGWWEGRAPNNPDAVIVIYWINPRRPAVGEEADLGVLVFLATYFFLPYGLCIMSMYPKDLDTNQIPL
ncbi:hypothetical protein SESBI_02819 [Sesbania bispinosa]|nr:hypothetical protein SESBI_02819 [Sesbania bispinosa]